MSDEDISSFGSGVKELAVDTLDSGCDKLLGIGYKDIKDYRGETEYFDSLIK
ncbi:MAG: hypothetical protein R6V72_13490 [Cyclobacterium sp.]|uniref:hypothetical protein n=1 Tax=Cyclobacterium sp. TaxID=1966343 RepID=UPI003970AED2